MSKSVIPAFLALCLALTACNLSAATTPPPNTATPADTSTSIAMPSDTPTLFDTATPVTPSPVLPSPVPSATPTPVPFLDATVSADLLSCRYGPGPEYLFLYGLRKGAQIKLIGQTGSNSWVWVDGKNKCWVNVKFIEIEGDFHLLPIVYPDLAPLPVSPYYPPTAILRATREKNLVTVEWSDVPLRPGDEEDETMLHYIVEVWRCEAGQIVFDPLATNDTNISFVDEPGCSVPSHGRIFVQEKHGFAGPTEIPWP
ncbi:MAG: hypothetical protein AB1750_19235 [Chloroflexota bacterium]